MAFPLGQRGSDAIGSALDQAVNSKQELRERPVTFGYENGAPTRFAGDTFKNMGMDGDFGRMTGDKKNKEAQDYMKDWVGQLMNGAYSPLQDGGPPPGGVA